MRESVGKVQRKSFTVEQVQLRHLKAHRPHESNDDSRYPFRSGAAEMLQCMRFTEASMLRCVVTTAPPWRG